MVYLLNSLFFEVLACYRITPAAYQLMANKICEIFTDETPVSCDTCVSL